MDLSVIVVICKGCYIFFFFRVQGIEGVGGLCVFKACFVSLLFKCHGKNKTGKRFGDGVLGMVR